MRAPPVSSLPAPLVARARAAGRVLEVGAGARFEVALALAAEAGAEVLVSDVDARVLGAPLPLHALVLDVTRPPLSGLEGVGLVVAVRLPEELQLAAARLARSLGADLALRPLKDEWADVSAALPRVVAWPDGWRLFSR